MGNWEGGWSQRYKGVCLLPVLATRYVPAIGTANIEERIVGSIATAWLNQKEHHGKSHIQCMGYRSGVLSLTQYQASGVDMILALLVDMVLK